MLDESSLAPPESSPDLGICEQRGQPGQEADHLDQVVVPEHPVQMLLGKTGTCSRISTVMQPGMSVVIILFLYTLIELVIFSVLQVIHVQAASP